MPRPRPTPVTEEIANYRLMLIRVLKETRLRVLEWGDEFTLPDAERLATEIALFSSILDLICKRCERLSVAEKAILQARLRRQLLRQYATSEPEVEDLQAAIHDVRVPGAGAEERTVIPMEARRLRVPDRIEHAA